MSKTRVFIYGSCVSRDTFEHLDPDQFELVQYVARQSALSAYTRPVTLVEPPSLESQFQQRMVAGDFASSLQALIPEAAPRTDLVLVDLTDERLGAYVLPDGSVVTRSTELIQSGAEQHLPAGSQHLPFGSEQHFQYWSQGIAAVGTLIRHHMPRAAVALLDIPWAERSETGAATPGSFGVTAQDANPIMRTYAEVAAEALRAQIVSVPRDQVTSSPHHPWGEAPFHYSERAYLHVVRQLTGADGRSIWGPEISQDANSPGSDKAVARTIRISTQDRSAPEKHVRHQPAARPLAGGPNFLIAGVQHGGSDWLGRQLSHHPDVFVARDKGTAYFNRPARIKNQDETELYLKAFADGQNVRLRGECTPDYFWHSTGGPFGPKRPNTARHIREGIGEDARILIVLRDPVSRALASYWHQFSLGRFDLPTSIFQLPKQSGVIDLGFYARHLRQWTHELGANRIHVLLYDDLIADPTAFLEQALDALSLEPVSEFWGAVSRDPLEPEKRWLKAFQQRARITSQEIAALVDLYRADIAAVEKLTGRELPAWRDRAELIRRHATD